MPNDPDPISPGTTATVKAVRRCDSGRGAWLQLDVEVVRIVFSKVVFGLSNGRMGVVLAAGAWGRVVGRGRCVRRYRELVSGLCGEVDAIRRES